MPMMLWVNLALAQVAPWTSYPKLVSANGRGVVVLNAANEGGVVLDLFSDKLYQQEAPDEAPVQDLLFDAYFALDGGWLREAEGMDYQPGTGLMEVQRLSGELVVTEVDFAPMGLPWPGYVQLLRVENTGGETRTVRLNSLHNHHVGSPVDGVNVGDEALWLDEDALVERGQQTSLGVLVLPLGATRVGCEDVFSQPGAFSDNCGTAESPWTGDDRVGGFEWAMTLQPGETRWIGTVALFFLDTPDQARAAGEAWLADRPAEQLVGDEAAWWSAWHAEGTLPEGLSPQEEPVYQQALALLKMAQVTEESDAYGQIPASLPLAAPVGDFQHLWNITWVRDQAYAIRALTAAGHEDEAAAALAFTLQDKAGLYSAEVGRDYGLSVCRLYGDGTEWSDDDGTGPNIELDNFGLTLWAAGGLAEVGALDPALVDLLLLDVADVLVDTVGDKDLLMADSSIWERHWNGNQKQFTYSTVWAVRGLREAALLAPEGVYTETADRLTGGVCRELTHSSGLLGNADEEPAQALDLAAVDAFNNGTLDAGGEVALASYATWEQGLAVPSGHGFKRNDDGDLYDEQEWVMVDLRLAEAYRRGCQTAKAEALEDWVTEQARANHLIIPELMDPETAAYAGPAPMMGFGSGLYVLTLHDRAEADQDCADGVVDPCLVEDSGGPIPEVEEEDCGCSTGVAGGWMALWLLALVRRRRE